MHFTDAYFVWLKINSYDPKKYPYIDFIDRLAFQLIHKEDGSRKPRPRKKRKTEGKEPEGDEPEELPTLMKLSETAKYQGSKTQTRLNCSECQNLTLTSFCCQLCYNEMDESSDNDDHIVALCAATKPCLLRHACRRHRSKLLAALVTE